ncbi:transposase [Paraclostridium sordellii]|uniref:transposase n=1 Tax=Paraclostridium sordellii TaxID=1505 RepID=UPI001C616A79|nr:transposase [Paeniclostridium sordellii]QYE99338.1 transposase [Paeniclostridium sordellii]
MNKKYNKYDKELKLKAVDMYLNEEMSSIRVAKTLGIKNKKQVQDWTKLYNAKVRTAFDEETRGKASGARKGRPKTKFSSLEEELNYLPMENEYLKKLHSLSEKKK